MWPGRQIVPDELRCYIPIFDGLVFHSGLINLFEAVEIKILESDTDLSSIIQGKRKFTLIFNQNHKDQLIYHHFQRKVLIEKCQ